MPNKKTGLITPSDFQLNAGEVLGEATHIASNGMSKIPELKLVAAGSPTDASREKDGKIEKRTKYTVYHPKSDRTFVLTVPGEAIAGYQFGVRLLAKEVFGGVAGNTVWINAESLVIQTLKTNTAK